MTGPLPDQSKRGGLRAVSAEEGQVGDPGPFRPDPPETLGEAGAALWRTMLDRLAYENDPDIRELDTLETVCALEDSIRSLEAAVKEHGEMIEGQRGPRMNPAIPEIRLARQSKLNLLKGLTFADEVSRSPRSQQAADAANVRWEIERKKWGRRAG